MDRFFGGAILGELELAVGTQTWGGRGVASFWGWGLGAGV